MVKKAAAPKRKKRRRKKKHIDGPPVQYHHQIYDPRDGEVVGKTAGHLFKGEHSVITALRRQTRNVSSFFLFCLEEWLQYVRSDERSNGPKVRNVDEEIRALEEGQSWHCKYCGAGFLVRKNRDRHEPICHKRGDGEAIPPFPIRRQLWCYRNDKWEIYDEEGVSQK